MVLDLSLQKNKTKNKQEIFVLDSTLITAIGRKVADVERASHQYSIFSVLYIILTPTQMEDNDV